MSRTRKKTVQYGPEFIRIVQAQKLKEAKLVQAREKGGHFIQHTDGSIILDPVHETQKAAKGKPTPSLNAVLNQLKKKNLFPENADEKDTRFVSHVRGVLLGSKREHAYFLEIDVNNRSVV
jgi:hypothetical protein